MTLQNGLVVSLGLGDSSGVIGKVDIGEAALTPSGDDYDVDGDDMDIAAVQVGTTVITDGSADDLDSALDGSIKFETAAGGFITIDVETGSFVYDQNGKFNHLDDKDTGSDGFEYKLTDDDLESDWATVDITINGINDPPVAADDVWVLSDTAIAAGKITPLWLTHNDSDPEDDPLYVTAIAGLTADGKIGTTGLTADFDIIDGINQLVGISGTAVTGDYSFAYTLSDGSVTDTATVTLEVIDTTTKANTGLSLEGNDFSFVDLQDGADEIDGDVALEGHAGIDFFIGGDGADTLNGGAGDDTLNGNANADTMDGGDGNDALTGGDGSDTLNGGAGDDTLNGNANSDAVNGGDGNDALTGGDGNDALTGGDGNDTLTGDSGNDTFRFVLITDGVDTIVDFNVKDDTIQLDNASFTTVGSDGTLALTAFHSGPLATQDADDRITYDSTTGELFYDADGSGSGTAIQIATLATGLAMTNADFVVI